MGCEVYANGDEIACKSGDGKVIAAFPDVCLSPPSPPAGPIPVPYPDTSFSKDMQNGSKTVMIKGKEVMLKDQSYYKTSPLGDEAATKTLGQGVVTHVITGKTYFVAWSMDVKFEGENVDRHIDLTTSNHASPTFNAPIQTNQSAAASSVGTSPTECPCCGANPEHANQTGGQPVTEEEWYGVDQKTEGGLNNELATTNAQPINPKTKAKQAAKVQERIDALKTRQKTIQEMKALGCGSLPDKPTGCGQYFIQKNKGGVDTERDNFSAPGGYKAEFARSYKAKTGKDIAPGEKVNHRTPLAAGGCPKSDDNLVPDSALSADCKKKDDEELTKHQATAQNKWFKGESF